MNNIPEKSYETIDFNKHSNEWPSKQDDKHSTEKEQRSLEFLRPKKELDRSFKAYYETQTRYKQNLLTENQSIKTNHTLEETIKYRIYISDG